MLVHIPWYAEAGKVLFKPWILLGGGAVLSYTVYVSNKPTQKHSLGDNDDSSGKAFFRGLFGIRNIEEKHTVTFTPLESRLKTYKASVDRASVHQCKGTAGAAPATAASPAAIKEGRVFVLDFCGDVMANQVAHLREEITAVTLNADPASGDQVVLLLHSSGGSVTGYGLASAQLARIRSAGLPLTVCVDEVAASGGYMMAAVADRIVASPFALIGSIGVIKMVPNVTALLEKIGVEVDDVTAGKYKRTLVPYKKSTESAKRKVTEDIELIMKAFVGHIQQYRGQRLNLARVATGETWMGSDALTLGLVDALGTSDEILIALLKTNRVLLVRHRFTSGGTYIGNIPLSSEDSEGWLRGESEGDSGVSGWMGSAGAAVGQGLARGFGRAIEELASSPRPPM